MERRIQSIINNLQKRRRERRLCSVGCERLTWWKGNGKKFKSPKAAILTWTWDQVMAWERDSGNMSHIPAEFKYAPSSQPSVTFHNIPTGDVHFQNLVNFVTEACRTYKVDKTTLETQRRAWLKKQPDTFFNLPTWRRSEN